MLINRQCTTLRFLRCTSPFFALPRGRCLLTLYPTWRLVYDTAGLEGFEPELQFLDIAIWSIQHACSTQINSGGLQARRKGEGDRQLLEGAHEP